MGLLRQAIFIRFFFAFFLFSEHRKITRSTATQYARISMEIMLEAPQKDLTRLQCFCCHTQQNRIKSVNN